MLLLLASAVSYCAQGEAGKQESSTSSQQSTAKPSSQDDLDRIGDRNIGGRGPGNWYSLEREIRIGKQYAQMVESSVRLVQDPVITEYLNRVGQNLVRNSDARVPFTIKMIDADEVNAFALPGGFLYVNSGLVLMSDGEAELAGVMAHEIAHVSARHAMRQMTRANYANLASIPLIFVGGGIGLAARSAAGLSLPITFFKFSRGFEEEADYLGVQYLYATGYDPQSFIYFFERMQAREKQKPGTVSRIFSSHPPIESRLEKSQRQMATKLPPKRQYVVSTSEFEDVKLRLALLANRRRIEDKRENRPTLRRTQDDQGEREKEDDRPTLKRRDENWTD